MSYSIRLQLKDPQLGPRCRRLEILLNEEVYRTVDRYLFQKAPFLKQDFASLYEFENAFRAYEVKMAKFLAVKHLSLRDLSSAHLTSLLSRRLISQETIDQVLAEYANKGLLDDKGWAERAFVRCRGKGHGRERIAHYLKTKGIDRNTIRQLLQSNEMEDELHILEQTARKRLAKTDMSDRKQKYKLIAYLIRKGFSFNDIQRVMYKLQGISLTEE